MNRLSGGLAKALVFPAAALGATDTSFASVLCGQEKLLASDGASGDRFGDWVSICEDVAVIGADSDDDSGTHAGSAYIFRYDPDELRWLEEQKLLAADGSAHDHFGESVSVFGDIAVIGAFRDDDNGVDSGSAYVFRFDGVTWIQEQKLLPTDGIGDDWFGRSVAIFEQTILIGTKTAGYVFGYDPDTAQWEEQQKLLPADGLTGSAFGHDVAICGSVGLIGAPNAELAGIDSGAAYVFRFNGLIWEQEERLVSDDAAAGDSFGFSVAIEGETAVVGARLDDDHGNASGSAYVFRFLNDRR